MPNLQQIIVSSFSDCREKNGIVTFMQILRKNASPFAEQGIRLTFANYVDFPEKAETLGLSRATKPQDPAPPARRIAFRFFKKWAAAVKYFIKDKAAKRPLTAFLLMMCTLSFRGLVVALKARKLDTPNAIHLYQDIFSAYFGQKIHRRGSPKVLVLHSGNDSLNQIFVHFYGMRGTRYETRIREEFSRLIPKLDGIVTLNERYAQTLREKFQGLNVRCIYTTSPFANDTVAADPSRYNFDNDRPIEVVAIGSLQYIKGFDLLIQAVGAMRKADRDRLRIIIVGDGPERASLQSMIDTQELHHIIKLNGESQDVSSFLSRADAYVLPSRDEGLPIALIEASNFSLPIITTRAGAIPEIFDEQACLFMEASADGIREALSSVSRGNVDLRKLSRCSKEIFDNKLSLNIFLKSYGKLFNEMRLHGEA